MTIPFGKYVGCDVSELPDHYVKFLHPQPWTCGELREEIAAEYRRRFEPQETFEGFDEHEERARRARETSTCPARGCRPSCATSPGGSSTSVTSRSRYIPTPAATTEPW